MRTFWGGNNRARTWLLFGLLACLGMAITARQYSQSIRQAQLNQDLSDAVATNQAVRVRELLRAGADPNVRLPSTFSTPPPSAWQRMNATALRLWRHQPPTPNEVPPTVLQVALSSQTRMGQPRLETIGALLNGGANPNSPRLLPSERCSKEAPLVMAVSLSQPQIVELLLDQHADATAHDHKGNSCLNIAAGGNGPWGQNAQSVALLLAHGADANAADSWGNTPLLAATEHRISLPAFKLLLEHGASVSAHYPDGETVLSTLIINHPKSDTPELLAAVKLLLAHSADVNACDNHGRTPLMRAAVRGQIITAKTLLAFGADREARDAEGHTALDWVRENKRGVISPALRRKFIVLLSTK